MMWYYLADRTTVFEQGTKVILPKKERINTLGEQVCITWQGMTAGRIEFCTQSKACSAKLYMEIEKPGS